MRQVVVSRTGRPASSSPASSPTTRSRYWWTDADGAEHRATLRVDAPHRITHVRVGRNGALLARRPTAARCTTGSSTPRAAAHRRLARQPTADHRARVDARRQLVGGGGRRTAALSGWFARRRTPTARTRWCRRTASSRRARRSWRWRSRAASGASPTVGPRRQPRAAAPDVGARARDAAAVGRR